MIFKNRESIEKYGENQSIYFVTKQSIWFVKKEGAFHFKRFQETILVGGILFILFFFDLFFYSFYVYIGNKEYLFLVIVLLCGRIALCCSTKSWNRRDRLVNIWEIIQVFSENLTWRELQALSNIYKVWDRNYDWYRVVLNGKRSFLLKKNCNILQHNFFQTCSPLHLLP